ncbi:MAG: pyridoxamine 5'-phosphate oxidase family protein, partial [Gammaproteobacteria bacterium]|nr:pyridoxamine 5'-phosphate oxidase family protein [Gammaproteobacteria bacterium]
DKQPLIFRMYGKGSVINQYHDDWPNWQKNFKKYPGTRQIITLKINKVQTSCGYAIPLAENMTDRDTLLKWAEKKGDEGIQQYWEEKNMSSLDGLPTHILKK